MFIIGRVEDIRISGRKYNLSITFDFVESKQFINLTKMKDFRNKAIIKNLYNLLHVLDNHTLDSHYIYSEMVFVKACLLKRDVYFLPSNVRGLTIYLDAKNKVLFVEETDSSTFERNKYCDNDRNTNKDNYNMYIDNPCDRGNKINRINSLKSNKSKYQKKTFISLFQERGEFSKTNK